MDHRRPRLPARLEIVLTNYVNGGPDDGDALAALLAKGALNGVHSTPTTSTPASRSCAPRAPRSWQEPAEQPWGVRDGAVRDPAGNLVRIQERR